MAEFPLHIKLQKAGYGVRVISVVVVFSEVGGVVCASSMPAQNLVDRHSLKIFNMEPTNISSNNSRQELMSGGDECDSLRTPLTSVADIAGNRTRRCCYRISVGEWLTIIILCYVNLINYMDRFTIAGKATVYMYFSVDSFVGYDVFRSHVRNYWLTVLEAEIFLSTRHCCLCCDIYNFFCTRYML